MSETKIHHENEPDPLAADRVFNEAFTSLQALTPPDDATAGRYFIKGPDKAGPGRYRVNVMSGNKTHALATTLDDGDRRSLSVTIKGAPANGIPNIAFMSAPPALSVHLSPLWIAEQNCSKVAVTVMRGAHYSQADAQFAHDIGLDRLCPDDYVREIPPGTSQGYLLEDLPAIAGLADMPAIAVNLPPATNNR